MSKEGRLETSTERRWPEFTSALDKLPITLRQENQNLAPHSEDLVVASPMYLRGETGGCIQDEVADDRKQLFSERQIEVLWVLTTGEIAVGSDRSKQECRGADRPRGVEPLAYGALRTMESQNLLVKTRPAASMQVHTLRATRRAVRYRSSCATSEVTSTAWLSRSVGLNSGRSPPLLSPT